MGMLTNDRRFSPVSLESRRPRFSVALAVVAALCFSTFPMAGAQNVNKKEQQGNLKPEVYQNESGSLPGFCGTGCKVATITAGAAATVLIVALIVHHHRQKNQAQSRLNASPVKFTDYIPGQQAKLTIPLTNESSSTMTVEEITVQDGNGALTLNESQCPFTLAPGESFQIPALLSTSEGSGRAKIRVITHAGNADDGRRGELAQSIDVSWGKPESRHHRLIP